MVTLLSGLVRKRLLRGTAFSQMKPASLICFRIAASRLELDRNREVYDDSLPVPHATAALVGFGEGQVCVPP